MNQHQVTCVTKPDRFSPHHYITHIGGPTIQGGVISREEAIRQIDRKLASFYVQDPTTRKVAFVEVVREPGKAPYLRTHADEYWNDNL